MVKLIPVNYYGLCYPHGITAPLLWTSEAWAEDFAAFLRQLCQAVPPQVLELHPPFKFYCNIEQFFHRYSIFEAILRQWAPDTLVVIENRFGTSLKTQKNTPAPFLLRTYQDFIAVSQALDSSGLGLRFAFDASIPGR